MNRTPPESVPASPFLVEQVLPFLDSVLHPKRALDLLSHAFEQRTRTWAIPNRPIVGGLSGIPTSVAPECPRESKTRSGT